MHPTLATHLHDECKDLVEALQNCHKEHPFLQYLGKCNDEKYKMMKCFRIEDTKKRTKNREEAKKFSQKARERYKETMQNN